MKLETFFEKFELLADAPDAVAKMRELVRTLAVSGQLFGGQESRKCPIVRMKDVCSQITDGEHATPHRISSGVPLATAKNVRDGFLDLTNTDYVALTTAEKCWKRCKPQHQDILMVCVGATTGRVCLAQNPPDLVLVRSVALIRPKTEQIEPSYLDLFLRSSFGQSQIWGNVRQSAQPCLYLGKMAEFNIPLPPLAEQKRIVAKVDELMALCDRLEAQQHEREEQASQLTRASLARFSDAPTPANLHFLFHPSYNIPTDDLRKSILTLAVQGHLSGTPASTVEEQTALLDSATDPQFPISYGVLKPGPQVPNGVRLVKSQHIRDWKVSEDIEYLISFELDAEFKRTKIKGGEVLLNLVGASIGRCAIAPASLRGANVSRAVAVITLRAEVDPKFFLILLTAAFTTERIKALSSGTAQPVLNLGVIRKMRIWIPPLAEQRRIVAKVEQLMALVDALEMQLAASRATAENLLTSLVTELTTS